MAGVWKGSWPATQSAAASSYHPETAFQLNPAGQRAVMPGTALAPPHVRGRMCGSHKDIQRFGFKMKSPDETTKHICFRRLSFSVSLPGCLSFWQCPSLLKIEVYYGNADRSLNRAWYLQRCNYALTEKLQRKHDFLAQINQVGF